GQGSARRVERSEPLPGRPRHGCPCGVDARRETTPTHPTLSERGQGFGGGAPETFPACPLVLTTTTMSSPDGQAPG
ncbi:MAG: hypothetical protein ACRDSP_00005, partial [Pseudonocardiaceae bacterium]